MSGASEPAIGWIREVVLDAEDPWALARFWAGLLGGTPAQWYPGWVTLEPPPHGRRLSFQGTSTPLTRDTARVHFDVLVADLAVAHARVIAAGATAVGEHLSPRPGPDGEPVPWRVYRDPAGHPFCLVGWPGRPQGPRRTGRIKPGGHPPGRPGPSLGWPLAPAA